MAKVEAGQIGNFNGKIGQVVLAKWRDVLVGRKVPVKSKKEGSGEQLDQRSKFALVTGFFKGLSGIINVGYQSQKTGMTPMNAAVKYHLGNAVTGVYPDYKLDYSKVLLSNANLIGEVDGGFAPKLVPITQSGVTVSWQMRGTSMNEDTSPDDLLNVLLYSVAKKRYVSFKQCAKRSELTVDLELPFFFNGDLCHGYMFFTSPNGKSVSLSEYLGQFTVLA